MIDDIKLIINGKQYQLIQIDHDRFIHHSKEPNPDFVSKKEAWEDTFMYKSIILNGKFYAPKL